MSILFVFTLVRVEIGAPIPLPVSALGAVPALLWLLLGSRWGAGGGRGRRGAASSSVEQPGANRSFITDYGFGEGAAGDARGLGVLEGRREAVRAPVMEPMRAPEKASLGAPLRAWWCRPPGAGT